jgi:hypothetical protein
VVVERRVASSVEELLDGAERLGRFTPADARSPAGFERVVVDGEPHVVKFIHVDDDFATRVAGDIGCLPVRVWEAGLYDVAADLVDHGVVGMARGYGRHGWGAAILMRDLSDEIVVPDGSLLAEEVHLRLLSHCAGMCARHWGWRDDIGLLPPATRWLFFGPWMLEGEEAMGWPEAVPRLAKEGWSTFPSKAAAEVADGVLALWRDPWPLIDALATTPSTFLHGDWKLGNLGTARDGRTVLIDWAYLGAGPACHELAWYLSLNRARFPVGHTKEMAIEHFRAELERHGVDTSGWWDLQLDLCLLGNLVQFGWEKSLGDDADELAWWCDRAAAGLARL